MCRGQVPSRANLTRASGHGAYVKAALNYAEAFPQEIEDAIAEDRTYDFDKLKRLIPSLEQLQVPAKEGK